jgi:hypothetical protein
MRLKVFAALAEDISKGMVWVPESVVEKRTVVKIKNISSNKVVFCEALQAGDNYIKRYSQDGRFGVEEKEISIF